MKRRLASYAALALALSGPAMVVSCGGGGGETVVDTAGGDSSASCGNGVVDEGEMCDGGDDCSSACTFHECGDGMLGPGEICDDANDEDGDACTSSCELGPEAIVDIALAEYYTCALSQNSRIKCWGAADNGRLGQPGYSESIGDDEPPSDWDDVDVADDVVELVAGREHVCALREAGTVICWGYNGNWQLGYGHSMDVGDNESPAEAGDLPFSGIAQLAAGYSHTCALSTAGEVTCWGTGGSGRLGYGDTMGTRDEQPAGTLGAVPLPGTAVEITAGEAHTCARLEGGDVLCWGSNSHGQLGTGNPDDLGDDETLANAATIDLGGKAVDIDAGANTTCAVLDDGGVRCWGRNNSGILGNGDTMDVGDRKTPAEEGVVMFEGEAEQVKVGVGHACVLSESRIYCWGANSRVGYNDESYNDQLPGTAVKLATEASHVEIGLEHSCAITSAAGVRCWGSNTGGRLGDPEVSGSTTIKDPSGNADVDIF